MTDSDKPEKPREVLYAEWSLWIWTAWTCLFGIYQTWAGIPEIEKMMTDQLQGMIVLEPQKILEMVAAGYALLAAASGWVVLKIGAGKNWARSSLMWGFALEALWALCPPYHGIFEYADSVPDFVFQGYALYLLYTKPGRDWFH